MICVNIYGGAVLLSFFYCVVTYTIHLLSSDSNIVFGDGGICKNIIYGDRDLYIYSHMAILKWEIVRKEQVNRAVK